MLGPISTRGGPPGGHNPPGRARRPRRTLVGAALLGPPPVPIFWYISHFDLEKNKGKAFRMERHRLEAELGQEHFYPPAERFSINIFNNNSPILGRKISINIFNSTISSQTLVHLLCSILLPEL